MTEKQKLVYLAIKSFIDENGYPPTRREIASIMGFKSDNAAQEHLERLARKGVIKITHNVKRGIKLLK